ncbi:transcriptional regulator [Nocardioides gansuensis]|uniref:Transcriptional regulator n=1 Tax=Nocardioides gansuensis TaxID=2138300 RepID=A0A2T8F6Y2_9ACTN|nr:helix-turn-helix domain-containing protein [Nocardioides gansuensis]PVG81472.1 transcriptional regulator [Nocardioides gansuensis]
MNDRTADPITSLAALDEPTRRRLYDYVVQAREPVGRDEASAAVGIPRPTAAFHLDRLAEEGLLDVVHQRLTGRTGPGAGRPSKLYLRSGRQFDVSLPQRRYDLAGELLAAAVEEAEATGVPVRDALGSKARELGRRIGEARSGDDLVEVLEEHGFEPRTDAGTIRLGNCPFHELAQRHTQLVCGMNQHLVDGLIDGIASTTYTAELQPSPGNCCVVLVPHRARP